MSKKSIEKQIKHPYIKVGKISKSVAKEAKIKHGDIYISKNYLRHIEINHHEELLKLGIASLTFVKAIIGNFNQIRKGTGNSYLLVIHEERISKVAAIELNLSLDEFWEVKTAAPRGTAALSRKELVWERERTP